MSTSWNQWRTNISSQDYNQVSVGGEGRVWKSSDSPDEPIRVWQFERAMAALYQSVVSNDLQYAVHYEHWEGIIGDVPCVTMQDGRLLSNRSRLSNGRLWVKDCFDPKSGALLTLEEAGLTYSYFDYRPFGSKLFPYRYVIAENSSVVVVAQVVELDNPTVVDPNLFNPRSDASVYPVCKDAPGLPLLPSGSKLVHEVNPRSRQLAQAPEGHMDVLVYAILGKDGKLHNLHGVGNSQTRDAAIEAVEQWRFQPYEVCGSPVDQPVGFQLSFTKSGQYTWEPWTP